jgi:uncharacterized protein (DUF488 family)
VTPVRIYTIGYESWGFDLWADELLALGVRTVVDVRELPLSRRPGWSKTALAEKLSARGIGYIHMRRLGSPAPLRHALRDGSLSFAEFAPQFRALLDERAEDLEALLTLADSQMVALMCWEEDPARCHRSLVAEALVRLSTEPLEVVDVRRTPS